LKVFGPIGGFPKLNLGKFQFLIGEVGTKEIPPLIQESLRRFAQGLERLPWGGRGWLKVAKVWGGKRIGPLIVGLLGERLNTGVGFQLRTNQASLLVGLVLTG